MSCLERGSTFRHTGTTQMNEYSSRSHSVFTIFIGKTIIYKSYGGSGVSF